MSHVLFTELSNEQQEAIAGGVDFQLDATFFAAEDCNCWTSFFRLGC